MTSRLEMKLPAGREAAREARRALDRFEGQLPAGLLDDIRLLVSELVTNSLRHAAITPSDVIDMQVSVSRGTIHVEVVDPGPGFEQQEIVPSLYQTSGWGLYFVEEIADRWGVFYDHGTHVWFEMELAKHRRDRVGAGG